MIAILYFLLYILLAGLFIWLMMRVVGLVFPTMPSQVRNILMGILVILAIIWIVGYVGLPHIPRL